MQRLIKLILSVFVFQSLVASTNSMALAEEKSTADQSDVDFVHYYAVFSKFKPGKAKEAREFIYTRFWSVDEKIGRKPLAFDPLTGPWDHMVFFRLEGGLADAEIANTSQMKKWNAEFQIQEGGPEESQLAQASFDALVDESVTGIFKIPAKHAGILESEYSFLADKKYFRLILSNCKPGSAPVATELLLDEFLPALESTGRMIAPFFCVAGIYDHVAFLEIDPSDLEHIETDKNDLAWIQAIGGEEKATETQSKYSELARKIRREVAVARW